MAMSGQNKKASLVWDQKNLLMNLGMEDTHLRVGVDMEGLTCRLRSHTLVTLDLMYQYLKTSYTLSLRPHTLVVKSSYTSSLRSHTLVSEGLIHCQHQVPYTSW